MPITGEPSTGQASTSAAVAGPSKLSSAAGPSATTADGQHLSIEQTAINFYLDANGEPLPMPPSVSLNTSVSEDPWSLEQLALVEMDKQVR